MRAVIGWLDCSAGISGDMLLGALVDAGAGLAVLQSAVDAVGVEPIVLRRSDVQRGGLGACKVDVAVADTTSSRPWSQVRALLERADLAQPVQRRALDAFTRLAVAEASVHRVAVDDVHFHEVGALDAIADVVGCAAGLHELALTAVTASTVTLGSGTTRGAHGPLPVPPPAVLALLEGAPVQAGPVAKEMTTPTGAALLASTVSSYGPLPPMSLLRTGTGAGGRDPQGLANVLRLVLGEPLGERADTAVVLETNVDDLDPRLWPAVLQSLLDEGALDVWLTPILMKKGRPAHTLSVLCDRALAPSLRDRVFRETSTLGVREAAVDRSALDREEQVVDVDGQQVRVKVARLHGEVVNAMPEWEDVAAAAAALGRPAKAVLQAAHAAAVQRA